LSKNCPKPDYLVAPEATGLDVYRTGHLAKIIWQLHMADAAKYEQATPHIDQYFEANALTDEQADEVYFIVTNGLEPAAIQGHVPAEYFPNSGCLSELIRWQVQNASRAQPELSLLSSIVTFGTAIARKARTDEGDRPNLFAIGVAESGGGKDWTLQAPQIALTKAGGGHLVGFGSATSASAIVNSLESSLSQVMLIDEIGKILSANSSRNATSFQSEIETLLLKLYSGSSNSCFKHKAFADAKDNKTLHYPSLSYYGVTTPSTLFNGIGLNRDSLTNGLISRNLLLVSGFKNQPLQTVVRTDPPEVVTDRLSEWIEYAPESGGVPESMSLVEKVIPISSDAKKAFHRFTVRRDVHAAFCPDRDLASVYLRDVEKARKLALIRACSEHGPNEDFSIEAEHAQWGIGLVSWLTDASIETIKSEVIVTPRERDLNTVFEVVQKAGSEGITLTGLGNALQRKWKASERREFISDLTEAGRIHLVEKTQTGGRNGARLFATDFKPK